MHVVLGLERRAMVGALVEWACSVHLVRASERKGMVEARLEEAFQAGLRLRELTSPSE